MLAKVLHIVVFRHGWTAPVGIKWQRVSLRKECRDKQVHPDQWPFFGFSEHKSVSRVVFILSIVGTGPRVNSSVVPGSECPRRP
jgi:hypothetical protein